MHTLAELTSALDKAKLNLMMSPDSAFFSTLCFSLNHKFDSSIPTACADGLNIIYNPSFFMNLTPSERIFLLLHETLHCAYSHMARLPVGACKKRWNIAADYVINLQLVTRGFRMPSGGLLDDKYDSMSTEEVYALIPDQAFPDFEMDIVEYGGNPDELQEDISEILIRAAIQSELDKDTVGTIPGELALFINKLTNPILPWNRILYKYLNKFVKSDYTFKKINRRYFPTHLLPSLYSKASIELAIAVDVSGSVTPEMCTQFISETYHILKTIKPISITLIQFDTRITNIDTIKNLKSLSNIKFKGGGGTKISPVFNWVNDNKPHLTLIFTDGYFNIPDIKVNSNVVWLIDNNKSFTSFGKVIHYEA